MDALKYATRKKPQPRPEAEPELKPAPRKWIGGIPQPTALEIAEGKTLRAHMMEPDDECLRYEHIQAWNAVQREQNGSMGLLRCSLCHTTQWGRMKADPCAVCGCKSSY